MSPEKGPERKPEIKKAVTETEVKRFTHDELEALKKTGIDASASQSKETPKERRQRRRAERRERRGGFDLVRDKDNRYSEDETITAENLKTEQANSKLDQFGHPNSINNELSEAEAQRVANNATAEAEERVRKAYEARRRHVDFRTTDQQIQEGAELANAVKKGILEKGQFTMVKDGETTRDSTEYSPDDEIARNKKARTEAEVRAELEAKEAKHQEWLAQNGAEITSDENTDVLDGMKEDDASSNGSSDKNLEGTAMASAKKSEKSNERSLTPEQKAKIREKVIAKRKEKAEVETRKLQTLAAQNLKESGANYTPAEPELMSTPLEEKNYSDVEDGPAEPTKVAEVTKQSASEDFNDPNGKRAEKIRKNISNPKEFSYKSLAIIADQSGWEESKKDPLAEKLAREELARRDAQDEKDRQKVRNRRLKS